ncbi:M16 family metallopeptidase [Massilia psychrophila]|uniref:Peptidase M16 n=1 Tax=Massilia psychrophila TaxID=1603353 RepID=A0A2G8SWQ7_9BURK|nr:M16 family metallopeptidase [Massilia psychrophila]PIL38236.1 peptidase M16 [Massilia psychrophila]GGE82518.1 zinc protease [Massilia psychrophila]
MLNHLQKTVCLAALLIACTTSAAAKIKLSDPIPTGPQVVIGKLENGLTYYIQQNGKPEKKLELRLVVKAGSILEDDDQQGLAHFTEHMAFNGSTHFKKHELVSWLQSIGVKFGADLNAYTSFDETVYILPIPTDKSGNVEQGFLVLKDWAHGLTLTDADIDMERAIVLEEARNAKGAGERINKIVMPKMYNGSRYAQRLPIGQEDILRTFKPDALRRFYRDWYRPDLMAVIVVGDIDPARAAQLVKAHFGGLRNPVPTRVRHDSPIPVRSSTEALVATDPEASGNAVMIRYPVRAARDKATFADYRDKLVRSLFGAMMGNRLQELAQQAKPPFIAGASGQQHLTARYETYFSMAALGKDGAEPAIAALVQENERARRFGFSAQELERGKKNLMRTFERLYGEREKTDSDAYVGELIRNFLERESVPGIENEYNYARELIPAILLDEMNRYARENIPVDTGKLVLYTGSTKAGTAAPSTEQLLAWVDAAARIELTARQEKPMASGLMDTPPAAGSIVAESANKALGLTTLTLSNGVKVILKPTDFANEQIYLGALRPGGITQFAQQDVVNARYANAVVAAMGIKDMSPLDVQKVMAGKTAGVTTGFGPYVDSVGGFAGSTDIDSMLQMLYLKFTNVRRDEDLFTSFLGKQVEGARNVMAQPQAVFADAVVTAMYGASPWPQRPPRPDDFAKLNLERAIALYKDRFTSASGMTFIMVGNFDVAKVRPLIATYLASLPTASLPVNANDVGLRPVRGVIEKAVFSGFEAKSQVAINFTGDAVYSRQAALRLRALVDVMNIRITDVLREKLTLIYGGGMGGSLERVPYGHYAIGASLPTGPANVDKVIAAVFAEIALMKEQGPLAADLDKVKQNWIQVHRRSLRENGYWMDQLQAAVLEETDPAVILTYEQRVAAITAQEVRDAARRYFDLDNYVQVVLYPEKK